MFWLHFLFLIIFDLSVYAMQSYRVRINDYFLINWIYWCENHGQGLPKGKGIVSSYNVISLLGIFGGSHVNMNIHCMLKFNTGIIPLLCYLDNYGWGEKWDSENKRNHEFEERDGSFFNIFELLK